MQTPEPPITSQQNNPTSCSIQTLTKGPNSSMLGTKEILLKGRAKGGIYSFDDLVVSRLTKNLASSVSVPSGSTPPFSRTVFCFVPNMHRHSTFVSTPLSKHSPVDSDLSNKSTVTLRTFVSSLPTNNAGTKSSLTIPNSQGVIPISRVPLPPSARNNNNPTPAISTSDQQQHQPTQPDDPPPAAATNPITTTSPIPISRINIVLPTTT
ncbi:hypothetical protein PIB30_076629 [Stylosanthes scabra]|uniref:Uncharacterized protein n=1 Tax=Stylosanthes scabra TaxID=79078 RepID=A0ABU6ZP21_9FABA|nr:hypothetical protein [Stylosanthes scabra]